ncbi:ATP-binding cassette domain-containing protein [Streptomyces sp. Ncost-T10-10d]|uniref:ATP-binding cassette domain-containing protein n=1 Tax=Streptomyces sp. Ncost-T10-10d TaxID=1839774 RepID=UPI00159F24FB|nr:ATP-binding cassette domain-containing protein [Streptomyces sp. Ncost-T10-10d]
MIEIRELTKRYGDVTAVDGLSFTAAAGRVTGLLGPGGVGKTTTLQVLLGLDAPSAGSAAIGGRTYGDRPPGPREVGSLLDTHAVYCPHVGNTARECLAGMARRHGIPRRRVDEVLELVGLAEVEQRRVGRFSLGMRQQLGIACALLGDPPVLVLDEPLNGLDQPRLAWAGDLFRRLAAEGRTVLLSGQLPAELAAMADELVVLARGEPAAGARMARTAGPDGGPRVSVRTPDVAVLTALLADEGASVVLNPDKSLTVTGLSAQRIGDVAFLNVVPLHELTTERFTL